MVKPRLIGRAAYHVLPDDNDKPRRSDKQGSAFTPTTKAIAIQQRPATIEPAPMPCLPSVAAQVLTSPYRFQYQREHERTALPTTFPTSQTNSSSASCISCLSRPSYSASVSPAASMLSLVTLKYGRTYTTSDLCSRELFGSQESRRRIPTMF